MAEDPLNKAVTKAEPIPQRATRASEEFYPQGPLSALRRHNAKRASLRADVDDYTAERGMNTRAGSYNKGGMVKVGSPKVSAPCKDTKTIKCY
jgi:hypothetical protein